MKQTELERVLNNDYGVGSLVASPECVLWAADRVADRLGTDEAKRQLSELNRKRERAGRTVAVPNYGTRLF